MPSLRRDNNDAHCRYILFNGASCAAYDIYSAAAHPEPLFPAPLIAAGGILRWKVFAQLPEPLVRLGINFVGLALYGVSSGIVAIIVFRFASPGCPRQRSPQKNQLRFFNTDSKNG